MRPRLPLLLLVLSGLAVAFAPWPTRSTAPQVHTFRIEARQFAYSPYDIRVNAGDTVVLQLDSTDVVHGLYVEGYDVSVTADPGRSRMLTFIAGKQGSFRFRCHVTCGALHPFMTGKLTVGSNDRLFRAMGLAGIAVLGAAISVKSRA